MTDYWNQNDASEPTQPMPQAAMPPPQGLPYSSTSLMDEPLPKKKMSRGKKAGLWTGGVLVALIVIGATNQQQPSTTPTAEPVAGSSNAGTFPTVDPSVQASLDKAAADKQAADAKAATDAKAAAAAEKKRKADEAAKAQAEYEKAKRELEALTDKSTYAKLSNRAFAKVVKNPDAYVGKKYLIYGRVSQFDAATGTSTFRADVDNTRHSDWYEYDVNSIVNEGIPGQFDDVVQDDLVTLYVVVDGSFSYDTQLGGSTTVPSFTSNMIKVTGSAN